MFNKQIAGEWQRLAFHKYEIGFGLKKIRALELSPCITKTW
jgi:hypothetical protein